MEKLRARDTSFRFGSFADNLDPAPPHLRPSPSLCFSLFLFRSPRERHVKIARASTGKKYVKQEGRAARGTYAAAFLVSSCFPLLACTPLSNEMAGKIMISRLPLRDRNWNLILRETFRWNEYRIVETDVTRANWIFKLRRVSIYRC